MLDYCFMDANLSLQVEPSVHILCFILNHYMRSQSQVASDRTEQQKE